MRASCKPRSPVVAISSRHTTRHLSLLQLASGSRAVANGPQLMWASTCAHSLDATPEHAMPLPHGTPGAQCLPHPAVFTRPLPDRPSASTSTPRAVHAITAAHCRCRDLPLEDRCRYAPATAQCQTLPSARRKGQEDGFHLGRGRRGVRRSRQLHIPQSGPGTRPAPLVRRQTTYFGGRHTHRRCPAHPSDADPSADGGATRTQVARMACGCTGTCRVPPRFCRVSAVFQPASTTDSAASRLNSSAILPQFCRSVSPNFCRASATVRPFSSSCRASPAILPRFSRYSAALLPVTSFGALPPYVLPKFLPVHPHSAARREANDHEEANWKSRTFCFPGA